LLLVRQTFGSIQTGKLEVVLLASTTDKLLAVSQDRFDIESGE